MLSSQPSGLVIFGDLNLTGKLDSKGKGKGKGGAKDTGDRFLVIGADGEKSWAKATMLRSVLANLQKDGRVAVVSREKDEK